ncbi:MAG: class I SAM-dependent methyltransferase [Candidatus Aureabacteria bacterium]|nr:class I SAM-dependent methyltransferase [Candidatus Auribacterota bacterium]NLW94561.1 class I SAM-dependent methyltransferase [Chlamydiota bacterium]HQM51702.1 class I SAM-dependent methyltransferase [bacterium]
MNERDSRFREIFLELFDGLPRQGPGNRDCAARALRLCAGLPRTPMIVDLGCGVGAQTLHLAELTAGSIVAVDSRLPSIERLKKTLSARGLSQRVHAQVGDITHLELPPESYDLVWSEGALYNIGIGNALRICHGLLRPGGFLAFTDAVWLKEDPPPEVKACFEQEYPAMGTAADVVTAIRLGGFEFLGGFTLPYEAWWDDFYSPMEQRIMELRRKYGNDAEALAMLDELAREPEMHRNHSDCYGYEFFVARRPATT